MLHISVGIGIIVKSLYFAREKMKNPKSLPGSYLKAKV
jgi:hypothetical protein